MLNILTVALKKLSMKGVSWPCVAGSVTFYEGLQNDSCILNTHQYDIHITIFYVQCKVYGLYIHIIEYFCSCFDKKSV